MYLKQEGAITDAVIDASGVMSHPGCLAFPWQGPGLEEGVYQMRPDNPGDGPKYFGPPGVQLPFNRLRDHDDGGPVVIVEGTKQALAVLSWAPHHYAVYGVAGCRAWSKLPLAWIDDRDVVVMFDGDMYTNRDVHDAAVAFREELEMAGAASVAFARIPAQGKQGIDDVLAAMTPTDRSKSLARWLGRAKTSPGKAPSPKQTSPFFDKNGLMVQTLASDILKTQPAALTAEQHVSIYRNGVYKPDSMALMSEVSLRLGEQHRSTHTTSAEQSVKSMLYRENKLLPERMAEPLANFLNTMVDLRTGATTPHDPAYLSRTQHPVTWDPSAACPVYDQWLMEVIPDQADDLEEVAGTMLDPSRTPSKALFAYGPSHSGKSTFLRLLDAIAGGENTSAVTLHALADDRFAAANVYGKVLNTAADLSPKDVSDLSVFKMMTGEDPVTGNRKYGGQFKFTNTALFAFSANELPAVGESSRAYANRMKPFHFKHSFAGREDPSLEAKLREELPGIVNRWVKAYQRFLLRGNYAPTDTRVDTEFEQGSDRVRQWVAEMLAVVAVSGRSILPPTEATTATQLSALFSAWATANGGHTLGRNKLVMRLTSINGVERVRIAPTKAWGLNLVVRPEGEQGFEPGAPGVAEVAVSRAHGKTWDFSQGIVNEGVEADVPSKPPLPPPLTEATSSGTSTASDPGAVACEDPATVGAVRGRDLDQECDLSGTDSTHLPPVREGERPLGGSVAGGQDPAQGRGGAVQGGPGPVQRGTALPFTLAVPAVLPEFPAIPDPHVGVGCPDGAGADGRPGAHRGAGTGQLDDATGVRTDVQPEPGTVVPPQGPGARREDRSPARGPVRDAAPGDLGCVVPQDPPLNPFLPFTLAR
jgi:putative DNA primase/helicase